MRSFLECTAIFVALSVIAAPAFAQTDPGVRINTGVNAGGPLPNLANTAGATEFFDNGQMRFATQEVVSGGNSTNGFGNGLGPRFNLNQCSACHSQPAPGGSSPNINAYPYIGVNPQSQVIKDGIVVNNTIPSFVKVNGPVLEARFPLFITSSGALNGTDGGVHDLFTVAGRSDAGNCELAQPNFNQAINLGDIIFRIPTPVFGAGLVENLGEDTLINNHASQAGNGFGVSGTFNYNGNDGTISRFGWKAQNKSGLLFSGEAYNVEMGITNELFQNERPDPDEEHFYTGLPANCLNLAQIGYPEDITNFTATKGANQFATNASIPSDIVMFAMFMRFLNQPIPQPQGYQTATATVTAASITRGQQGFSSVGCAVCHTPQLITDQSQFTGDLSGKPANLYSDLEIHHMGGLADNVMQGSATGDQFRSAPLWGIGQRVFFLHDGRAPDLLTAIMDHCLQAVIDPPAGGGGSGSSSASEACMSEEAFENLPATNNNGAAAVTQQDVLNFLRSL
ncbi:MAG TPA: di-heme oxidoredictase family protein [Bryobacteraceae bacterium]|nr:di-heme oxidoredictase family protein [Bryobacteraceae bacterium]